MVAHAARPPVLPPWVCKTTHTQVTLHHAGTKRYLAALVGSAFGYPIDGHLEVCGMKKRKAGAAWYAAEGLYLPPRGVTVRGGGTGSTAARNGTDCERDEL